MIILIQLAVQVDALPVWTLTFLLNVMTSTGTIPTPRWLSNNRQKPRRIYHISSIY